MSAPDSGRRVHSINVERCDRRTYGRTKNGQPSCSCDPRPGLTARTLLAVRPVPDPDRLWALQSREDFRVDDVGGSTGGERDDLVEHVRELDLVLVAGHVPDVRGADDVVQ